WIFSLLKLGGEALRKYCTKISTDILDLANTIVCILLEMNFEDRREAASTADCLPGGLKKINTFPEEGAPLWSIIFTGDPVKQFASCPGFAIVAEHKMKW